MLKSIYHKDKTFTLGILGGGQLAKMLAASAYRLGLNVAVIENHASSPAGDMTKSEYANGWFDKQQLADFIEESDIITLENEFIDPEILDEISKFRDVYPGPATMRLVQDKFIQKTTFRNAGLPVPGFAEINSLEELLEFGNKYGYPFVLKARKYGYDGYGNSTIFKRENCEEAWKKFKSDNSERLMMAEAFVNFNKELAVIAVRNTKGETEVYPCVETVQYRHICHEVIAPAEVDEKIRLKACKLALDCVKSIDGIGVFGVEMFLDNSGELLINEIAPRPHNSGHYTIEACFSSQFENCIRAVCGLPLGSSKMVKPAAVMINLLGQRSGQGTPDNVIELLRHTSVYLHLYNKKQSRIGRKMGHLTALSNTQQEALTLAKSAADAIKW